MPDAFEQMRKNREKSLETYADELTKHERARPGQDDRFWKLDLDQAGNGEAVIRFLPPAKDESSPTVTVWSHAFQGPGGWYINNCLTTLGQDDPVCEMNRRLYNSGIDADKETVKKTKRKQRFIANIYVVSDPAHPENEGKVFLYEFGPMIYNKIKEAYKPKFQSQKPVNVFDLWEGANFRMMVWTENRGKNKFPQYDRCTFDSPSQLKDSDDKMKEIWESQYPLQEFIADDKFESYEDLKKRLDRVMDAPEAPQQRQQLPEMNAPSFPTQDAPRAPARESAPKADDDDVLSGADNFFDDLDDDIPF